MSIRISRLVWEHSRQNKSGALVVLLAIADYANEDGIAWPAVGTLARKTRMSKRNVQRWLKTLERDGELKVFRNEGRHGSNVYKICLPVADNYISVVHDRSDTDVATRMTPTSSRNDASVTQFTKESLVESSPIIPKGEEDFWIKVSFSCFRQAVHPLRPYILRALCRATGSLNKHHAPSLIEFYQTEPLASKEHPYSSRRRSPERLLLDLARQLALAIRTCPPPPPPSKPEFSIREVREYLTERYSGYPLPASLEELESSAWEYIRPEIYRGMRDRKQKNSEARDPR